MARRRGGSLEPVAPGAADGRRSRRGTAGWAAARPRRGPLHGRHPAARNAPHGDAALPPRARTREANRPGARAPAAGSARGARPGRGQGARGGGRLFRHGCRRGRRRHIRPGTARGGCHRRRVGGAGGRARPRAGRTARAAHDGGGALRTGRLRARARNGRRRDREHVSHLGRPAQLDGDAPGRVRVGRRHARRLHLDAVHLGRARSGRAGARHPR